MGPLRAIPTKQNKIFFVEVSSMNKLEVPWQ